MKFYIIENNNDKNIVLTINIKNTLARKKWNKSNVKILNLGDINKNEAMIKLYNYTDEKKTISFLKNTIIVDIPSYHT